MSVEAFSKVTREYYERRFEASYMNLLGQAVDVVTPEDIERYGDSPLLSLEPALREGWSMSAPDDPRVAQPWLKSLIGKILGPV